MSMLNFRGYAVEPTPDNVSYIKENLTFIETETDHNKFRAKKTIECFWIAKAPEGTIGPKNYYYVPREFGFRNFGVEKYNYPNVKKIKVAFNGSLREKQIPAIEQLTMILTDPSKGGGIANLHTGWGKTCGALYLISILEVKTIIVLHKLSLIEQWKERISQFLPNAKVGVIQGRNEPEDDCDIVLASLQSLSSRYEKYKFSDFNHFGFLIVDEVHNMTGTKMSRILKKMQLKYRLGLSATMKTDIFSEVYLQQIGPIAVIETKPQIIPDVKIHKLSTEMEVPMNKNDKINHTKLISDLMLLEMRNLTIVRHIVEIVQKENRRPLVLTQRRGHVDILKNQIKTKDPSISVGIIVGNMKPEKIEESKQCQILIGTMQAASEGFDHPVLDTLVFATPKSISTVEDKFGMKKKNTNTFNQALGRILRQENPNKALVIDFNDYKIGYFKNNQYKRNSYYKERRFNILND